MDMKRLYITYCSGTKDNSLKSSNEAVTPDKLYISRRIERFADKCRAAGCKWAILSDKYGVVFSDDKIRWYEKAPDDVTAEEYKVLCSEFLQKTNDYEEIWFFYEDNTFHPLHKRLINECIQSGKKIIAFNDLEEIK